APLGVAGWLHPTLARRLLFPLADLIRAVPLLFLIFWFYFLIPLLVGGTAPGAVMVVVALTAFNTASVMYLVVAGFRALPAGQSEAAHALGFTPGQIVRRILAPQALPNILPSALGLGVMLIKDTSLAFIVNVPELTTVAGQVNGRLQVYPAEIFLTVGALYFLVCGALVLLANRFHRKRGVRW
ncbi:MAG TPA: amino acid ABC transporter permease, partial [Brevundimonas sp.]|nr:amino acid ABC transporter permease [Brevundimonas sp.]